MDNEQIYTLIKAATSEIRKENPEIEELPEKADSDALISDYGFDIFTLGELERDLELRTGGHRLDMKAFMVPEDFYDVTMGEIIEYVKARNSKNVSDPILVYVDDEEENLFIFKRKFKKDLNCEMFSDPKKALEFIKREPRVTLVVTDEVMPGYRGNELLDEVKKVRPSINSVLITGNPEQDDGLLYRSLKNNRFYDFIQKPVDFDTKKEKYLELFKKLLSVSG